MGIYRKRYKWPKEQENFEHWPRLAQVPVSLPPGTYYKEEQKQEGEKHSTGIKLASRPEEFYSSLVNVEKLFLHKVPSMNH